MAEILDCGWYTDRYTVELMWHRDFIISISIIIITIVYICKSVGLKVVYRDTMQGSSTFN